MSFFRRRTHRFRFADAYEMPLRLMLLLLPSRASDYATLIDAGRYAADAMMPLSPCLPPTPATDIHVIAAHVMLPMRLCSYAPPMPCRCLMRHVYADDSFAARQRARLFFRL